MVLEPLGRLGEGVRELLEEPADVRGAVRRVGRNVEWVERKLGRLLPSQLIRRLSASAAESRLRSLESRVQSCVIGTSTGRGRYFRYERWTARSA